MNELKIGLVLPGGGARGAYQLGVMLALKKYGLLKHIKAISGGSIGVFTMMCFLMRDFYKAYNTFKEMNSQRVLGYKKGFINKLPIKGNGFFSRGPLISFINQHFDLAKYVDTKIPLYASVAKVNKTGLKTTYSPAYFRLNNLSHERVLSILLATSAIPRVFDEVLIGGNKYVDCLKADNEPFLPLTSHDINALFVIPLTSSHNLKKYSKVNIPVVDFECSELRESPIINMIDFETEKVDLYLNCGYFNGLTLLHSLYKNFYDKKKGLNLPKYYHFKATGIKIYPSKLFTIEEILKDSEEEI